MRRLVPVAAVLLATLLCVPPGPSSAGEDRPPSWELLSRDLRVRGNSDWAAWWWANRGAFLNSVFRAKVAAAPAPAPGQPVKAPPVNAAARERARTLLLAELKSKEILVASEAALALGRLGDANDIHTLALALADEKQSNAGRLRTYAAIGLGLLPAGDAGQSAEARDALLAALAQARAEGTDHRFLRAAAAYALAMRGDAAALPRLVELNREARSTKSRAAINAEVLGAVAFAIGALGGAGSARELEDALRGKKPHNSGNKDASWAACHAATRLPPADALKLLRVAVTDDREQVRRVAIAALGAVAAAIDDEVAAILRKALSEDKDSICRQAAALALGRMGHATSTAALLKAYQLQVGARDRGGLLMVAERGAIAVGLGLSVRANPDPKISALLLREIEDANSPDDRAALSLACGLARIEEARAHLTEFASRPKGDILAATAASALGLVGAGASHSKVLFEGVAQSAFADLRGESALALGRLGDVAVVERLRTIVAGKRTGDVDKATAGVCLGYVGDDADIDFLVASIQASGSSGQVRACLVQGLGRLLDRGGNQALARVAANSMWFKDPGDASSDVIWEIQFLAN